MKLPITILIAVSALWFGSFIRAAAPPIQSDHPSLQVEQSTQDAGTIKQLTDNHAQVFAAIDAIRWTGKFSAVLLAFAACAYLPKKYRSFGALLRWIAQLMRDPYERFCMRARRCWFLAGVYFDRAINRLSGSDLAINSAVGLNARQAALAERIIRAIDPEGSEVAINAPGIYRQGEVTEWDRSSFVNAPLATNASQFAGNNPHEYLSQYAVRYVDPNLGTLDEFTDLIAPAVMSNNARFVEYALYGFIDAFLSLDNTVDDIRGIGADFPTLRNPTKSLVTQRMNERGLAVEVDEAEEILPGDVNEWQQQKIAWLIGIGTRTRLRRAVALFVAIATAASKTWDTSAGKDPDQDILDELDNLPIRPTDIIFGTGAWSKRNRSHRAQTSAGGFASAAKSNLAPGQMMNAFAASRDTADDLAGMYGVNSVRVSRHRKATGASTIGDIIGSLVLMFNSQASPSRFDFTNLKTFRAPALSPQGAPIGSRAVYVRQIGDKRWRIAVSFGSELVAVTSSIGAEVITVS